MPQLRRCRLTVPLGVALLGSITGAGCHSTFLSGNVVPPAMSTPAASDRTTPVQPRVRSVRIPGVEPVHQPLAQVVLGKPGRPAEGPTPITVSTAGVRDVRRSRSSPPVDAAPTGSEGVTLGPILAAGSGTGAGVVQTAYQAAEPPSAVETGPMPQTVPPRPGAPMASSVVEESCPPACPAPCSPRAVRNGSLIAAAPVGIGVSAPNELAKIVMPPYVIEPPDILLVELVPVKGLPDQPIRGQHLVRPDGTVGLGIYGSVRVAGLTIAQAQEAVGRLINARLPNAKLQDILDNLSVDVLAYNSKFFYVVMDGGGYGEQVYRLPFTGSETVLDAIGQINGLPPVSSKTHIWVARRPGGDGAGESVLPVNWLAITRGGSATTNYQLFPGDRVFVKADKWVSIDSAIAKRMSPLERLLGVTLLSSQTVNSIKNRGAGRGQ